MRGRTTAVAATETGLPMCGSGTAPADIVLTLHRAVGYR